MKTILPVTLFILVASFLPSCQKSTSSPEEDNQQKADAFKAYLTAGNKFRPVSFYSDKPIDYILTDSVEILETDLNQYIRPYLLDDDIYFNNSGTMTFVQNAEKIPADNADTIRMPYSIQGKKEGVYVLYIDDQYNPLDYFLHEYSDNHFILLYTRYDGARLFSRYEKVQ